MAERSDRDWLILAEAWKIDYSRHELLSVIRQANVFAPEPLGVQDVWIAAGRIVRIGAAAVPNELIANDLDARGKTLIPGLIDGHVHVTGGGGEAGPETRVPPISAAMLKSAGITTCIGLLGTDGTTRTIASLVARTLGLRGEGLSAYCFTGSYQLPLQTLTGSVRSDITFVDPIIGVGELAISDHRSSQPTFDELVRVASDAYVAGMMSGKAGVLHLHLGDGPRGLELVRRALEQTELPARVFHPTHVNRNPRLLEEAFALSKRGCTIDVTAFDASAADAIARYLDAGLTPERITCSSDGCGCLPVFDGEGRMVSMDIGKPSALFDTLKTLLDSGRTMQTVLPAFTSNVAKLMRLSKKGRIALDTDADLVLLDAGHGVCDVMAMGRWVHSKARSANAGQS